LARTTQLGYDYYVCTGRSQPLRIGLPERCPSAYVPATALDTLVWQDLCRLCREPTLVTHELARAQAGEWLPQLLHARRQTLTKNLDHLTRQQTRLLDAYLAEIISQDEFTRKHQELTQTHNGLTQQLRQLEAQARQHLATAALASGVQAFCQRVEPSLDQLTFAQRRQLVELLIDRVIIDDHLLEIRYAIPTAEKGASSPFVICD
jgi:site-specific DNA recombinase